MYSPATFAVVLGALAAGVRATSSFIQPPAAGPEGNYRDNPIYDVGEKIDMQWSSDLDLMNLLLWQEYPPAGDGNFFYVTLLEAVRYTSLIWEVSFDGFSQNVTKGQDAVFFLALYMNGSSAYDTSSHYFNVTLPSTTTTSATHTPTVSASDKGLANPTGNADSSETTGADSGSGQKKDSGLSTGAVAGIAVGATIGGLAVLGAAGFFLWRHFRRTPGDASGQYNAASQQPPPVQEYYKPHPQTPGTTSELPGTAWTHGQNPQTNVSGPGGIYEAP